MGEVAAPDVKLSASYHSGTSVPTHSSVGRPSTGTGAPERTRVEQLRREVRQEPSKVEVKEDGLLLPLLYFVEVHREPPVYQHRPVETVHELREEPVADHLHVCLDLDPLLLVPTAGPSPGSFLSLTHGCR